MVERVGVSLANRPNDGESEDELFHPFLANKAQAAQESAHSGGRGITSR